MNEQQYQTPVEEQEIDLVELIAKLWHNRGLIIKTTVLFMVVGLMVALFSAKVFSAGCEIVPQTGNSSSSSSVSRISNSAPTSTSRTPTASKTAWMHRIRWPWAAWHKSIQLQPATSILIVPI